MRLHVVLLIVGWTASIGLTQEPVANQAPQAYEPAADDNAACDSKGFIEAAIRAEQIRKKHRLTTEKFIELSGQPNTIVLDARGSNAYGHLHVKGSVNLPYTAFSQEALQRVIPSKSTRILIYCRNNFTHIPIAAKDKTQSEPAAKDLDLAFAKDQIAGLNIPTFITLFIYGYHDVWELDTVVNPEQTSIQFEGTYIDSVVPDEQLRAPKSRTLLNANGASTTATR